MTLLGRGSGCINTGGEKVFPEEVEEALKIHPDVVDAIVIGLPDERWGQRVAALVGTRDGRSVDSAALDTHLREHLADYKLPKQVCFTARVPRADNGKADLSSAREMINGTLTQE